MCVMIAIEIPNNSFFNISCSIILFNRSRHTLFISFYFILPPTHYFTLIMFLLSSNFSHFQLFRYTTRKTTHTILNSIIISIIFIITFIQIFLLPPKYNLLLLLYYYYYYTYKLFQEEIMDKFVWDESRCFLKIIYL